MSCAEVGRLLQQYLDHELDDDRDARLAAHLEECRRCGLEAEAYERIKAALALRGPTAEDDPALRRLRSFAERLASGEGGTGS
jgi:anti-sigma factor (TIGR02949 family)